MKGHPTMVVDPVLERAIIEFQLARNVHIPPSELARMSKKKVMILYKIMQEVLKQEAEEIRKGSKR